ncbi:nicotinate phosphoribosyltransferase [Cyclospora cayetanensis]|uniref:nicotinate phosphoribosyltransferase n=1 Tax=Cyclospora cayetanensis TaxID=88456 RepID=A0A1D3D5T9_9EIME|nr:nicotinate phosphoribosyltransferase [Cyclospora cayetanensis]
MLLDPHGSASRCAPSRGASVATAAVSQPDIFATPSSGPAGSSLEPSDEFFEGLSSVPPPSSLDRVVGAPVHDDRAPKACPLLMDYYQLTMAYAYWRQGKHNQPCVFEASFRRPPFQGSFAILGGVSEVVSFILGFRFSDKHLAFLRSRMPSAEEGFFDYLRSLDGSSMTIRESAGVISEESRDQSDAPPTRPCCLCMPPAIREGSLVFPKVPVLQAAGPLGLCQMVETSILNILGYATLVATNAARHRLAAGWKKKLFEFGARRAQGPDGALTASRYAYLGGFDGTSNVQAAYRHEIPLAGTMAHAFVSSFASFESLKPATSLLGPSFPNAVLAARDSVFKLWHEKNFSQMAKEGELAAFTAYAMTFPDGFLALVDTYNTLSSGIPNFLAVALALFQEGHTPQGIRIDSGDLAYLSREARQQFKECEEAFNFPFSALHIVVSNDLNEAAISALNDEGHEADVFGIGTNVVTCQSQPALGMVNTVTQSMSSSRGQLLCWPPHLPGLMQTRRFVARVSQVYKLVELEGKPCMKLSEDVEKTSLPTAKAAYRLYNKAGIPAIDLIQSASMPPPVCGRQLFCKDLYDDKKRCFFIPKAVEELLVLLIKDGKLLQPLESIEVCSACSTCDSRRQEEYPAGAKHAAAVSHDVFQGVLGAFQGLSSEGWGCSWKPCMPVSLLRLVGMPSPVHNPASALPCRSFASSLSYGV